MDEVQLGGISLASSAQVSFLKIQIFTLQLVSWIEEVIIWGMKGLLDSAWLLFYLYSTIHKF